MLLRARRPAAAFAILTLLCALSFPAAAASATVIVSQDGATDVEQFAAREVQRYVYLRTGELLPLVRAANDSDAIVVAAINHLPQDETIADLGLLQSAQELGEQDYLLRTARDEQGRATVYLVGGSDIATLYAAYRFAEHLGIRFYLHGDVIPDEQVPLSLPELDEKGSPLFSLRGIQPFHDFPEGPDWWNANNYKAIIGQLPKLRMNFIGLHTYPENRPNAEPTVWIGLPEDVEPDGGVAFSYPASYYNTAMEVGWGFSAKKTGDYYCGAAALFDRDDYGSEIMRGLTPMPDAPEDCNEVFERTGALLRDAFELASKLGVKTCVGTETPLVVPQRVQERMGESPPGSATLQRGSSATPQDPVSESTNPLPGSSLIEDLYAGIFTRIMNAYPIDYYWFWTPEGWTWEGTTEEDTQKTIDDILAAKAAAERVGAPFQLATSGWVLGPQFDRAYLDKALPKDFAVSSISRAVGHDPVEPAFAEIEGREKWAIPWLEDDPAMTSPQLWVSRMRRDARDALDYGCTGLMGIHWRTRILGPNVAALAQAAWDQSGWGEMKPATGPVGGNTAQFALTDFSDTDDDPLYQSVRYDMSAYRFVVPNGTYTVTLHLCEPYYFEPGKRVFGYRVEDTPPVEHLDVYTEVGPTRALVRTVEDVAVEDGVLDIDFIKEIEFPCIAALEVVGENFVQRINCGGEAYNDFIADPAPVNAGPLPDDFYLDWAAHEFGSEVGEDAARILSAVDGKLPRPSNWIGGPGGYTPDEQPWDTVKLEYAFVDEFAALRDRVTTPGNRARFDYWLNTLEYLRASAKVRCAWGALNAALRPFEPPPAVSDSEAAQAEAPVAAQHPPRHFVSAPFQGGVRSHASRRVWYNARIGEHLATEFRTRNLGSQNSPFEGGSRGMYSLSGWQKDRILRLPYQSGVSSQPAQSQSGAHPQGGAFSQSSAYWQGSAYSQGAAFPQTGAYSPSGIDPRATARGAIPPLKGDLGGCSFYTTTFGATRSLDSTLASSSGAPHAQRARDTIMPRWTAVLDSVREMYRYLLATVETTGEMGTVCNWEQHTFPALLDDTAAKLTRILGEPVSPNHLRRINETEPRIIVPAIRTAISPGEDLIVPIIILDTNEPREVLIHYRPLGTKNYATKPAEHVGRNTYQATIPAKEFPQHGIEYYVEAATRDGETVRWPVTAGRISQTVIL